MVNKAHEQHQLGVEKEAREFRKRGFEDQRVKDNDIVQHFEDAAGDGLTWREALRAVGRENGLINVDGVPRNRWARGIIVKGQMAYRRARAQALEQRRLATKLRNHG
jgi:hypothetical protein